MKERYENLDGIRAFAAIAIILMHVLANGGFAVSGFVFEKLVPSFTNLTYFFMLLSAFSMCCGYYEKFRNNTISLEQFYRRRYDRIWPFFALLCTLELIVEHNLNALYEWFADLTLAFGLLPNADISVVGVGWFIGVVFVFYMIFPFFTCLIGNKKRAWFVMVSTIIMNVLCRLYFFDEVHVVAGYSARSNFLFSSIFFVAGGLIYLYREQIKKIVTNHGLLFVIATIACLIFYYLVSASEYTMLILFSLFTFLDISGGGTAKKLFQNKAVHFMSSVSMEIYLCHMFVFRAIERMRLLYLTRNEIVNYTVVSIATVMGAVVMAVVMKKVIVIASNNYNGHK